MICNRSLPNGVVSQKGCPTVSVNLGCRNPRNSDNPRGWCDSCCLGYLMEVGHDKEPLQAEIRSAFQRKAEKSKGVGA